MNSRLVCVGCGAEVSHGDPYPFRCPRAEALPEVAHVLVRRLDPAALHDAARGLITDRETRPFQRYRRFLHGWNVAAAAGERDAAFMDRVEALDVAVDRVDGHRFRATPFEDQLGLAHALGLENGGALFVKNETGNVSGSHKGRHLFNVMLWLRTAEALGWMPPGPERPLAIASCGNAALAAAVVARAAGRVLHVFVPPDAHPRVLHQLAAHGAHLVPCPRDPGQTGDPCFLRFREAVRGGAIPFTVQGSENGVAVEGGLTLGYELGEELERRGVALDRLFVQVGGGALASGTAQGLRELHEAGLLPRMPRIHCVQTENAHPLARAYDRVVGHALERAQAAGMSPAIGGSAGRGTPVGPGVPAASGAPPGPDAPGTPGTPGTPGVPDGPGDAGTRDREALATWLAGPPRHALLTAALEHARTHAREFMTPWETPPHSFATGILDDETYDWPMVVEAMLRSGGYPILASEDLLREAHALAHDTTGIPVCPTGASGLAGLMRLRRDGVVSGRETVAVLFTGHER